MSIVTAGWFSEAFTTLMEAAEHVSITRRDTLTAYLKGKGEHEVVEVIEKLSNPEYTELRKTLLQAVKLDKERTSTEPVMGTTLAVDKLRSHGIHFEVVKGKVVVQAQHKVICPACGKPMMEPMDKTAFCEHCGSEIGYKDGELVEITE